MKLNRNNWVIKMEKPEHGYKHGSILESLIEKDWSDKTVLQVADELGSNVNSIKSAIYKIKQNTGYQVRYLIPPDPECNPTEPECDIKRKLAQTMSRLKQLKQIRDIRKNARCDTCWNTDCRIMEKRKVVCWIGCKDYIGERRGVYEQPEA